MLKRLYIILLLIIPVLTLTSCKFLSGKKSGHIIAECYGQYLYADDLEGIVVPGLPPNDSIAVVKQFIDNWIMQQIMLQQAENNLTEYQRDFTHQVEAYRNSLIIYAYESELIAQKLDTAVSMAQIEEFYNNNQHDFQLRENIVKAKYIKIPAGTKQDVINKAERLLKSDDLNDIDKLLDLCQNSMLTCYTDDEDWIRFDDLIREIPMTTDDQETFLKNRRYYKASDSLYVYLINFKEVKTKEAVSPLSFEIDNIRNLILNRRKIELMDRMQQEVFKEAMKNKDFTIY
jgi:hypothetical protein